MPLSAFQDKDNAKWGFLAHPHFYRGRYAVSDGAIRAEQNSPTGARFIIELPLADAKSTHEGALASANGRLSS